MTVTFILVGDVVAQLNASGPDSNSNYTVYGLTIADSSLQAHVDYANTWVNALFASDLDPAEPRYSVAKLAALDLAAIRVLVISSGGSLVGAYDYFLGDLRVARAGPYASAIQRTIQGLKEDLSRQVVNLSTPAKGVEAKAGEEVPRCRGGLINP